MTQFSDWFFPDPISLFDQKSWQPICLIPSLFIFSRYPKALLQHLTITFRLIPTQNNTDSQTKEQLNSCHRNRSVSDNMRSIHLSQTSLSDTNHYQIHISIFLLKLTVSRPFDLFATSKCCHNSKQLQLITDQVTITLYLFFFYHSHSIRYPHTYIHNYYFCYCYDSFLNNYDCFTNVNLEAIFSKFFQKNLESFSSNKLKTFFFNNQFEFFFLKIFKSQIFLFQVKFFFSNFW